MPLRTPKLSKNVWLLGAVAALAVIAWLFQDRWLPSAKNAWGVAMGEKPKAHAHDEHDEAAHAHAAAGDAIEVSDQARRNIGLKTGPIRLDSYGRTVSIPAIVAERPGRTDLIAAAPLTGFVDDVFAVPGQAVSPGDPLFVLRLTNEEVVQAQTEYLKTLEALDVENKEIARLESIRSGVIAEKAVLERKYERQKLEGLLKAQRQALLLHGLSEQQVESIAQERRLLREFLITAPEPHDESEADHLLREHPRLASTTFPASVLKEASEPPKKGHPLVVRDLPVRKGQVVTTGQTLGVLSDLERLYIEGQAFERDAAALVNASREGWSVSAIPQQRESLGWAIDDLKLAYVANEVDPVTRALRFYVSLPNEIVNKTTSADGDTFLTWRYKPGQRMEVRVPVEKWTDQIVVPVEAVAQDGVETYVFVEDGRQFVRHPVNVVYRDRESAVLANDGSVFPGEVVALNCAHQLQLALKNSAGGAPDPHAGHHH